MVHVWPSTADAEPAKGAWLADFERRANHLMPLLLNALGAARQGRREAQARCLDRALRELTGLAGQARLRATQLEQATDPRERQRQEAAQRIVNARFQQVAGALTRCGTEGPDLEPGVTRVELLTAPTSRQEN